MKNILPELGHKEPERMNTEKQLEKQFSEPRTLTQQQEFAQPPNIKGPECMVKRSKQKTTHLHTCYVVSR